MIREPRHIKKGDKLVYQSALGNLYSAIVQRVHKDGTWTLQLFFNLDADGKETGCFQGDKFRVGTGNLVAFWYQWNPRHLA